MILSSSLIPEKKVNSGLALSFDILATGCSIASILSLWHDGTNLEKASGQN
jgi:hypothetical protein